jgi:HD-like signal output (HDOD) protein
MPCCCFERLKKPEHERMLKHTAIVQAAHQLKPLPPTATRLAALTTQEAPDIAEIIDIVSLDPVLVAKLLRFANSCYSSPRHPIGTVAGALRWLGTGPVLSLAVGSFCRPVMEQSIPGYSCSGGDLWKHSVTAAVAAGTARDYCHGAYSPLAFTAALLHDLGKLVLGTYLTPELISLCQRAVDEGHLTPVEAECEILSVHHGEVGGIIAQYWSLPADIVTGIIHHHTPDQGQAAIGFVVHLADAVARQLEGKPAATDRERRALEATRNRLGLTPERLASLCEATAHRLADVLNSFNS